MEFFTATGKLNFFFDNGTHWYDIQVLPTHASTRVHRYSSLLKWSVTLSHRGHVAMVFCTKCKLHSNHRLTPVIFRHTKNFSPGATIFSLHTLASPSGRNVNYDKKNAGKKFDKQPTRCKNNNFTINNFKQLNMFRAIISPILRSTTLCLQLVV